MSNISNLSKDSYINFLFKSFESIIGKSLDDINTPQDLLIGKEINESNYLIMFACFKTFYNKNKLLFLGVKLSIYRLIKDYQQYIASVFQNNQIGDIFEMIINLCCNNKEINIRQESPRDELLRKQSVIITKKKSNLKNSSLENVFNSSPKKEIDENGEIANSLSEEMFPKVYSNKMTMKRIAKNKGRLGNLIEPYETKIKYFSKFNENLLSIRKDTKTSIRDNFSLVRKQDEIIKISKEMILYNNPNLNLDSLSNNTYNNFVKKIINTYNEKNLINDNHNHLGKNLKRNYSNPNFSKN